VQPKEAVKLFWLLLLVWPAWGGEFTGQLWSAIAPIYDKTVRHPFLAGLADGTLPRARFDFYLEQDALYLSAFSRALSLLAAKAPREEWALTLNRHAVEALEVERKLHESLLGPGRRTPAMAPSNFAYTNHLIAAVSQRPFAEGLAALLPCYWIYWEVGKQLKKRGSKNPDYQRWIDQYAGEEYGATVRQVLEMMDQEARAMSAASREAARKLFEISARYEYMFWDMAWREEAWPP
jgi:thiaminase/transcriptional activator TenA